MFTKAKILKEKYGKNITTPFLQELIWFHRIKEDQDKELLALEFLNVCASQERKDKLFNKNFSTVSYKKDMQIRTILYNFPELEFIVKSSAEAVNKWEEIEKTLSQKSENPYSYKHLKKDLKQLMYFIIQCNY